MACRGCSQAGDCACVIVGDGTVITVLGTGSADDPYEVNFNGTAWVNGLPQSSPNVCTENLRVLVRRADNSIATIPFPKPCARIV